MTYNPNFKDIFGILGPNGITYIPFQLNLDKTPNVHHPILSRQPYFCQFCQNSTNDESIATGLGVGKKLWFCYFCHWYM